MAIPNFHCVVHRYTFSPESFVFRLDTYQHVDLDVAMLGLKFGTPIICIDKI